MSMLKKYIKSWLAKQALWQVHEQHQFDLLYMLHNLFEGNMYKYILPGIDITSRYKVARSLRTKNSSQVSFVLEAMVA